MKHNDLSNYNSQDSRYKNDRLDCFANARNDRKTAFTLAETLITLVIIGIVAAITVPAVMNNINSKQKEEKVRNVYQKLSKSTDKMLGISGMNGYASTNEFLSAFKNHLSIAKICKPENIQECWGSKEVNLGNGEKWQIKDTINYKYLKISNIQNRSKFDDVMGFVMNDGTPFIISYNKNCDMSLSDGRIWAGDKSSSTNCIAGVFDYNGGKKPNKLGDDVLNFNASSGLGTKCSFEVNGNCYTAPQVVSTPMTSADCNSQKEELGLSNCKPENDNSDYYATAAKMCGGKQNIISADDLQKIAEEIYGMPINSSGWTYCNGKDESEKCKNNDAAIKYGIGTANTGGNVITSTEYNTWFIGSRLFATYGSIMYGNYCQQRHTLNGALVICRGD